MRLFGNHLLDVQAFLSPASPDSVKIGVCLPMTLSATTAISASTFFSPTANTAKRLLPAQIVAARMCAAA